jgi:hypothetical protein
LFAQEAAFHSGIEKVFLRATLTAARQGRSDLAGYSRLIPLAFSLSNGRGRHDGCELLSRCWQMHTCDGVPLLNFTSRLHSGFRFGLSRHKFATGVTRKPRLQRLFGKHLRTIAARRERLADTTCLPKR